MILSEKNLLTRKRSFPYRLLSKEELTQLQSTSSSPIIISGTNGVVLDQGNQSLSVGTSSIVMNTNGVPAVTITQEGYVGIGTTSPSAMLHVRPGTIQLDGATSSIGFNDGTSGIIYSNDTTGKLPSNGLFIYGATDGALGTSDPAYGGIRPIISWNSSGKVAINTPISSAVSTLSVGGGMNVTGNLTIGGNATIAGTLTTNSIINTGNTIFTKPISGTSATFNQITVSGASTLSSVSINGNLTVSNTLTVSGASTLNTLTVSGASTLNTLTVSGASTLNTLTVSGASTLNTLTVSGASTLNTLTVSGASTMNNIAITGNASISGLMSVYGPMSMTMLGIGTSSAYLVTSSQSSTLSVNGSIFASGTYGFYSGNNYNNCIRTSWNNKGYLDYTGSLSFRHNNGSGVMSTVMTCSNKNVGIGNTNPSALFHVNTGSSNNSVQAAMGYSGYTWDNTAVVFSNGSLSTSPGIAFGYSSTMGTISCGQPGTGSNDLQFYAKSLLFQPFSSAGSPASSFMMITSSGNVGIGTSSTLGALDVYGGTMYIRGTNAGLSFRDNMVPYSGSSYYVNAYMNSNSSYYDMGGMKIVETSGTSGSPYQSDLVFYTNYNSGVYESMRITGKGELQLPASSSYGHIRFVHSTYSSFFKNNGTDTYLFLTDSGDPYGSFNTLRPFSINHSTGLLSSQNGQVFSGGMSVSNGLTVNGGLTVHNTMTANNGLTVTGGATITNGLTVNGGLTTDTITANQYTYLNGGATITGALLSSAYWSINLYGISIFQGSNGTNFNVAGAQPTITNGTYAYTTPTWVGSSVLGTSPITNISTTNPYYRLVYTGIYSISFTIQTTGVNTFESFISYSTTVPTPSYDPLNSAANYVLACTQTSQQEATVSWIGYLSLDWYVSMGVYVNTGSFLPSVRSGLTITLLQRSA